MTTKLLEDFIKGYVPYAKGETHEAGVTWYAGVEPSIEDTLSVAFSGPSSEYYGLVSIPAPDIEAGIYHVASSYFLLKTLGLLGKEFDMMVENRKGDDIISISLIGNAKVLYRLATPGVIPDTSKLYRYFTKKTEGRIELDRDFISTFVKTADVMGNMNAYSVILEVKDGLIHSAIRSLHEVSTTTPIADKTITMSPLKLLLKPVLDFLKIHQKADRISLQFTGSWCMFIFEYETGLRASYVFIKQP